MICMSVFTSYMWTLYKQVSFIVDKSNAYTYIVTKGFIKLVEISI